MKSGKQTSQEYDKAQKVAELFKKLAAGDKFRNVLETLMRLQAEGKDWGRAAADALELHKCPLTLGNAD